MPEAAPTTIARAVPPAGARRRLSDVVALAMVAAAVGLVSAAAAPSVARELGWTSASQSSRRDVSAHHPLARPGSHPGELDRGERARSPHGSAPGMPDLVAPPDDVGADEDEAPDARLAVTVRDVVVRDRANDGAAVLGRVGAGELLIVIREAGAWAMVAHLGEEGSTTGWVRRGDLAIR